MAIIMQPQVSSNFKNPDNMDKLFIYEVVNFDNNIESIVAANTNNFLKLQLCLESRGLITDTNYSPQIKILSEANDMSLKINTDYVYITNDSLNFLEQTDRTYLFTVQRPYSEQSTVYFLAENSWRAINETNDEATKIIADDENLRTLYSIGLQNIQKMATGKNSTINFMLVESLPDIKKIESIDYEIPINSFYQTIQVIGDLKNDDLGITLENEKIDLELSEKHGFIPITCRLTNCNVRAEVEVLNFSLPKQLPLSTLNKIVNNHRSLISIFDSFKDEGVYPEHVKELILLVKKLILVSYAYIKNFDWFDKNNQKFINYFNATYANKTFLEISNNLIYSYETRYSGVLNSSIYKIFKALCYSLSSKILTPFGASDELTDVHKSQLWVYLELNNQDAIIKKAFNEDGSFNATELEFFEPYATVESHFFNINRGETIFDLKPKNVEFSQLGDKKYLPGTAQTSPDEHYYQLFIFFENWADAIDIMQNFSTMNTYVKRTQTVYIQKEANSISIEELKVKLPNDIINLEQIGPIVTEEIRGEKIYEACPVSFPGMDVILISGENGLCHYKKLASQISGETSFHIERKFTYQKLYKFSVTFNYESTSTEFSDVFSYSSARIFNIIQNIVNKKNSKITFKLAKRLNEKNWYITKIKEDLHYALLNSADKININYINKKNEAAALSYTNLKSFQQLDNKISLTKNQF